MGDAVFVRVARKEELDILEVLGLLSRSVRVLDVVPRGLMVRWWNQEDTYASCLCLLS